MTDQRGEKNHNARLSEKDVREIRARYRPTLHNALHLAEEYGVTRARIYDIVHWKTWKHVSERLDGGQRNPT